MHHSTYRVIVTCYQASQALKPPDSLRPFLRNYKFIIVGVGLWDDGSLRVERWGSSEVGSFENMWDDIIGKAWL